MAGMLSRLPIISSLAARGLSLFAAYAPNWARRGKIYRLIARFCDGHVVTSRYGVRMHVNRKDRTNQLCVLGAYETVPDEIAKLKPGMCFIDIGANAGLFSLMAAERVGPDGVVIAFEPSPQQYGYLIRNIRANGFRNILPLPMAVSDMTQRIAFSAGNAAHSGKDHVLADGEEADAVSVFGVKIAEDLKAVASFCRGRKTMIKIDVEGFEQQVLRGIRNVIAELPVVSMIMELDQASLSRYGASSEELYRELDALGFAAAHHPVSKRHYDEVFVRRDLVGTWEGEGTDGSAHPVWVRPASPQWTWSRIGRRAGWLTAGIASAYALAVAAVALVDPYGITDIISIPRINAEKTQRLVGGGRVEKSLALWREDHDVVILGGTPALMGINPDGPAFAGFDAYNAAIPAATMAEIYAVGRFIMSHGRPKKMIIALDFSMFEADRTVNRDFERSGFDGDWMPAVYIRALASPEAIFDAAVTVYKNLRGMTELARDDGFQRANVSGDYDYRKAFTDVLTKEFLVRDWHYADFDYDPSRVRLLEDLLRRLSESDTRVYVFVSPIHARQLEATIAKGLYPVYETWLRALARVADRVPRAEFWDFSGYNAVTTEEVPDWGDPRQEMVWYWNSARYTPSTGDVMIARMCGLGDPLNKPDGEFGRRITGATIETILAGNHDARALYALAHHDEVADVQKLVQKMAQLSAR
ncbi:FkbM family methyltransferase [Rhodoligotrophos ferricapiens]|uniref:FkbM family methyltransferase n=1 Tax=Rhodoligotrophos ferricapiens TaxID=3069264 RepID=UPI00315C5237